MTECEFKSAVQAVLEQTGENRDLAKRVLAGAVDYPCFVVGRNDDTAGLIGRFRIDGLVDDFAKPGETWNGLAAVAAADLPADAIVINGSTSISPVAVGRRLRDSGVGSVLALGDLLQASDGAIDWPAFVRDQRDEWRAHASDWCELFSSFEDAVSKRTLLDVLRYRLTANAGFMRTYAVRMNEQYFEPFLDLRAEVFVDAGGFDGDTTEEFCRRDPDYRRVHLFEPSDRNMRAAKTRLAGLPNIVFHSEALSDQQGTMRFDPDAGSASAVTSDAGQEVQVTSLDLAVEDPVTLIKMDLEGWELKALAGCERHIREERPKLAIAVYHQAADFRTVWTHVRAIHPDYRVYLRHYTQGWSETVMFFV